MADDEETVEVAERGGRDRREIHRCNHVSMVLQKSQPALSCIVFTAQPSKTWPLTLASSALSYRRIIFGLPFGAAKLLSAAGISMALSKTQKDSMKGFNSGRGWTNESFIELLRCLIAAPVATSNC